MGAAVTAARAGGQAGGCAFNRVGLRELRAVCEKVRGYVVPGLAVREAQVYMGRRELVGVELEAASDLDVGH